MVWNGFQCERKKGTKSDLEIFWPEQMELSVREKGKTVVEAGFWGKDQKFRFGCVNFKMPTTHPGGDNK